MQLSTDGSPFLRGRVTPCDFLSQCRKLNLFWYWVLSTHVTRMAYVPCSVDRRDTWLEACRNWSSVLTGKNVFRQSAPHPRAPRMEKGAVASDELSVMPHHITSLIYLLTYRPGREADRSPPSSTEVRNAWSYTSTPRYVFMAWCLVKLHNVV
jgi:hypothetical protein